MITVVNQDNQQLYKELFRKINDKLEGNYSNADSSDIRLQWQKLAQDLQEAYGVQEITSIEMYYSIIQDLIKINPKYGMLPLDEPLFDINANTREIIVPKNFGIQVQGDEYAETIFFKIHRYFDAMDLASQNIMIVWEDNEVKGKYYGTEPWVSDIENARFPESLLFGWVLGPEVTKNSGTIKFSVNFYTGDNNNKDYSFNTLPATIQVKAGMVGEITAIEKVNMADKISNGHISNTVNVVEPYIGYNIPQKQWFNINDEDIFPLENNHYLAVESISPNAGSITYLWQHSDDGENWIDEENNSDNVSFKDKEYDIEEKDFKYYVNYENNEKVLLEDFVKNHSCFQKKVVSGGVVANNFVESAAEVDISEPILLCYSTYLISQPGYYRCKIQNVANAFQKKYKNSRVAYFPEPIEFNIENDINLSLEEGLPSEAGDTTELKVVISKIENNNPSLEEQKNNLIYKWSKKISDDYEVISSETSSSLNLNNSAQEGYYKCSAFNNYNGETKELNSVEWYCIKNLPTLSELQYRLVGSETWQSFGNVASLSIPQGKYEFKFPDKNYIYTKDITINGQQMESFTSNIFNFELDSSVFYFTVKLSAGKKYLKNNILDFTIQGSLLNN